MGLPHPLLHNGFLLYVATILGRAKGRLFICPFPAVSEILYSPTMLSGIFCIFGYYGYAECRLFSHITKEEYPYEKTLFHRATHNP